MDLDITYGTVFAGRQVADDAHFTNWIRQKYSRSGEYAADTPIKVQVIKVSLVLTRMQAFYNCGGIDEISAA